mmetsp:Transcript_7717/g.17630  ORF Transcript_7717/g.17630 Transcript_7717/m.17630 type:complete len:214 (+) Transcript_7717:516-1157(+)
MAFARERLLPQCARPPETRTLLPRVSRGGLPHGSLAAGPHSAGRRGGLPPARGAHRRPRKPGLLSNLRREKGSAADVAPGRGRAAHARGGRLRGVLRGARVSQGELQSARVACPRGPQLPVPPAPARARARRRGDVDRGHCTRKPGAGDRGPRTSHCALPFRALEHRLRAHILTELACRNSCRAKRSPALGSGAPVQQPPGPAILEVGRLGRS